MTVVAPSHIAVNGEDREKYLDTVAAYNCTKYEQCRRPAAKSLGIRVSALDKEVRARKKRSIPADHFFAKAIIPWPEQVDGTKFLVELREEFHAYLALPPLAAIPLSLWVLHTWCHDAAYISPILLISSPEKRCGKTTLLLVLQGLVNRPLPTSNITPAALFRVTEQYAPTLLVDEADTFLRGRNASDDLRGILNSGHNRGSAFVLRLVGDDHEPKQFSTWAPKAVALIGKVHTTLVDRSIVIPMCRKRFDDQLKVLRSDRLDETFGLTMRRCARWARDHIEAVRAVDPQIPLGLNDRAADNWRPMLAIAEVIGCREQVVRAIAKMTPEEDTDTLGVLLLEDINEIYRLRSAGKLSSAKIVSALCALEERPWFDYRGGKPINQRQLARLLAPYGIKSKAIRIGDSTPRGYEHSDFADAFTRYVPADLGATPQQSNNDDWLRDYETATATGAVADEKLLTT